MTTPIVQSETLEINHEVDGEGVDVLLLHGLGLSSLKTWRYQIPELSKHVRVHAIDLRGFGKSNNPDGKHSVQQHVYDIKALLDTLGIEKVVLVGFSMGGWIAQQFALDYPERLLGLVLSCTTSGLRPQAAESFVERAKNIMLLGKDKLVDGQIKNTFAADTIENNPDLIAFYKACFMDPVENNPVAYAAMFRSLSVPNLTPQLHLIRCPTLIICGLLDNGVSRGTTPTEAADILHRGIVGSELLVMQTGGHYAHLEQPTQWNDAVLAFLQKHFKG